MCALCSVFALNAQTYGVRVNGTTDYKAEKVGETDYQEREQFLAANVPLNQGDKFKIINLSTGDQWVISNIDKYGEYENFEIADGSYVCKKTGCYDFYIKTKYNDDMLYIGAGANCSETPGQGGQGEDCVPEEHKGEYRLVLNGSAYITTYKDCDKNEYFCKDLKLEKDDNLMVGNTYYKLENGGASANFEYVDKAGVVCKVAGTYNVYIKPESQMMYIALADDTPIVEPEKVTVRFFAAWEKVNAYAWDANENQLLGAWPGKALTKGEDGWYAVEIAAGANIIFNNGEVQTVNIEGVKADICYELGALKDDKYTVVENAKCELAPIVEPETREIALVPRIWDADGAKFAVWSWAENLEGAWSAFMVGKDTVRTQIPAKATKVLFARINGSIGEPAWGENDVNVWNRTEDLELSETTLVYTIIDWGEEGAKSTGTWEKYIPTSIIATEGNTILKVENNQVTVSVDEQAQVVIYNVAGQMIDSKVVNDNFTRTLNSGLYIIKIGGQSVKAIVR